MIYAHAGIRPGISGEIMATTNPAGFNVDKLRDLVRAEYDRLAREPRGNFHFHLGPEYACRLLRYDPEELATIPAESTASLPASAPPIASVPSNQAKPCSTSAAAPVWIYCWPRAAPAHREKRSEWI